MIKVYLALMVVGILGAAAWGAKYYYDSTQARISQLVDEVRLGRNGRPPKLCSLVDAPPI